MPKKYTEEILDQAYKLITINKCSANQAAKELGIDCGTMRKRLKEKYGLVFLPDGKKSVDSNFFSVIDTEEKAYWLGFLTADGNLNKNSIELGLAEIDKSHIEKFKQNLKSEHKIVSKIVKLNGKEYKSFRISIKDNQIAKDLIKYGFTNKKSYEAFIPFNSIPDELLRHYFRGLFDGDGSIYSYTISSSNKIRNEVSLVSGSAQMIEDVFNLVKEKTTLEMRYRKSRKLHELRLHNQASIKVFLKWLYEDCTIYLERKHTKALAVLDRSHM